MQAMYCAEKQHKRKQNTFWHIGTIFWRNTGSPTHGEIIASSKNVLYLNDHAAKDISFPFRNGCVTKSFTVLGGQLENVAVENKDVYLLAYTKGLYLEDNLCAMNLILLTKDPRFPVIPLVDIAPMTPLSFDIKNYLEKLTAMISLFYPNVTLPPMKTDILKKKAKNGELEISYNIIKNICSNANISYDIFSEYKKTKVMDAVGERLREYGYAKIDVKNL